ncbi:HET-domain-containing protein, partial [Colletotrichum somersetense]
MLLVTHKNQREGFLEEYGFGSQGSVVCFPRDSQPALLKPQVIPDLFDYSKARHWVDSCRENHRPVCDGKPVSSVISGLKLIDSETLCVKAAEPGMQWVTLSYVWDPQSAGIFAQVSDQLPSDLSACVKDALEVTANLGYRYLWVDKYCINQRDGQELDDQIHKMDLIYNNAELTIVAAAGPDETYGLPGIGSSKRLRQHAVELNDTTVISTGPDPATYVEQISRWWKRGWT